MRSFQEVMAWLEARVVREGACLIWTHAMRGGVPQANVAKEGGGRETVNVRRMIWTAKFGHLPKKSFVVICSCGHEACVAPAHLKETSRSQMLKGQPKSALAKLNIAKAARTKSNGKLTEESLREIRESDESNREIAARLGISTSHVWGIRTGRWCREVARNPFSGLGA